MVNAMAANTSPTDGEAAQLLAAHASILISVHSHIGTQHPIMLGFAKLAQYPSPTNASIIISTSLPIYTNDTDRRIRNTKQDYNYMRKTLKEKLGIRLSESAARCAENQCFLRCVYFFGFPI